MVSYSVKSKKHNTSCVTVAFVIPESQSDNFLCTARDNVIIIIIIGTVPENIVSHIQGDWKVFELVELV